MDDAIDIQAFIRAFQRRWWLVILPAILTTPIAAAIAFSLPAIYSASATILIESQQIPSDLAQTTVTAGVEERISLIRQRLTARQQLLDIAEKYGVFKDQPDMSPSEIVSTMREATLIRGVSIGRRRGPVTSIEISYTDDNAAATALVANEFLTLLLEQNVRQRNEQAIETVAFFDREVDRLNGELSEIEAEIARFKNANQDALPDSLASRRSELLSLEERLFERDVQRAAILERREAIETALAEGDFSFANSGAPASTEEIELRRLNAALVEARSVYADSHPRVRLLLSRISVLQSALERASAEAEANLDAPATPGVSDPASQLRQGLRALEAELRLLESRAAEEQGRVTALRDSIARTPNVELQLNALQRRYSNTQAQYNQAVSKRAQAQIGERLEVNQQAERFEVIEQAQRPTSPIAPNRKLIVAAGGAAGLAIGFGLVVLLELLNKVIRTPRELERALEIRPFATIPYIENAHDVTMRRWTRRAALVGAILIIPIGAVLLDRYVAPLPLLFERALDTIGISALDAPVWPTKAG